MEGILEHWDSDCGLEEWLLELLMIGPVIEEGGRFTYLTQVKMRFAVFNILDDFISKHSKIYLHLVCFAIMLFN